MSFTDGPIVHSSALVESDEVGAGTQVWAFAHIMKGAVVGENCKIGDHSFIESGARLGNRVTVKNGCLIWHGVDLRDDVFVGPGVVFTNDMTPRVRYPTTAEDWLETVVLEGASIGANTTVLSGIRIGRNAMIGAGSVVTKDVPDHALMLGNPARQKGWVCECGTPIGSDIVCPDCGRSYQAVDRGLTELGKTP